jgi:hypothetical protein
MARVCCLLIVLLLVSTPLAQIQQKLNLTSSNGEHYEKNSDPTAETHKTVLGAAVPAVGFGNGLNIGLILSDYDKRWFEKSFDITIEVGSIVAGTLHAHHYEAMLIGVSTMKALLRCYWLGKDQTCYNKAL